MSQTAEKTLKIIASVEKAAAIAAQCLEEAGGDVMVASTVFKTLVKADAKLYVEVMTPYFNEACHTIISDLHRKRRKAIWNAPIVDTSARVVALARGNVNNLMNFPLPGGKRLGTATKEEIAEASVIFMKQARNMQQKGRWLELIVSRLKGTQTVAEVLSEKTLITLKDKAEE